MTEDEKVAGIRQAIANYFDIDDPDEVVTFVIGIDRRTPDGNSLFSSIYHGLTPNWAIGNLEGIRKHIEGEQNRAALQHSFEEMTSNSGERDMA